MNLEEFQAKYVSFKDADKIQITCDHPQHSPNGEIVTIGKQPARRNIMKNGGSQFICRQCFMHYNNPVNRIGESRQTDELIIVHCPHLDHEGETGREMKKAHFYGEMTEPYVQVCKTCAQFGKQISEEQRKAISVALKGITRSDEFKNKLRDYMKNNPEGIARASNNLVAGAGGGWNEGLSMPEEVKKKMSESHMGKTFTEDHCLNISEGRKKMLDETGGFTREHRENISKAVIEQYRKGFEPKLHHLSGWHESPKAGKVFHRSSYEKKAFLKLDADDMVKTYETEKIQVSYFHPVKEITSMYLVDLCIEYVDGSKKWVEVKPEKMLDNDVVCAKVEAAEMQAEKHDVPYEVWTEMNLFGHVYNEKNMRAFVEKVRKGEV